MRLAVVALLLLAVSEAGCVQPDCPAQGDPIAHEVRHTTLAEPLEPGLSGNATREGLWVRASEGGTSQGSFQFHVEDVRMGGATVYLRGKGQTVDGLSGVPEYPVSDVWVNRTLEPGIYQVRLCTEHRYGPETDRVDVTRHRLELTVP